MLVQTDRRVHILVVRTCVPVQEAERSWTGCGFGAAQLMKNVDLEFFSGAFFRGMEDGRKMCRFSRRRIRNGIRGSYFGL